MGFRPLISENLRGMPEELFHDALLPHALFGGFA
jgi:hypothetical protein